MSVPSYFRISPGLSEGAARGGLSLRDGLAGLSVALVLIPQSLAYAELAGMPPHTGLYAAALPAIVAAFFASSAYLQTGPVALTSLLTLGALLPLAETGSVRYVALAALLALVVGATRILLGVFRFGLLAYLMSQPLLLGFTSAAGVLILASQVPGALDVAAPEASGVVGRAVWTLARPDLWSGGALALSAGTVGLVVLGSRLHPLFPGVLLATVGGVVYAMIGGYEGAVVGSIPAGLPLPDLSLPWSELGSLVLPGVVIGLVGFAEPASIARTYAAEEREPWNPNREFVSQGLANLVAGTLSAFPVGGSFSRSSVNRLAGATSRWSGAIAGGLVLLFLPFSGVLSPMPIAVLSGIIVAAVVSLVRLQPLARIWRLSRPQAVVAWSTFILTLALSPRIDQAVLLGILLSVGVHLWRELPVTFDTWSKDRVIHLSIEGVLWFGSAPVVEETLMRAVAEEKDAEGLVIHLQGVGRIDLTGARTLEKIIDEARSAGLWTWLEGVPPHGYRILRKVLDWDPERDPVPGRRPRSEEDEAEGEPPAPHEEETAAEGGAPPGTPDAESRR